MGWGWVSVTSCLLAGGAVVWSLINSYGVFLPLNCPLKFPNWKRASGGKKGETCVMVPSAVSLDISSWCYSSYQLFLLCLSTVSQSASTNDSLPIECAGFTHIFFCVCVFLLQFIAFVCLFVCSCWTLLFPITLTAVMQAPSKDILESLRRRADEGQESKESGIVGWMIYLIK